MPKPSRAVRTFPNTAAVVAFPLGGIGTGNVSLGARGELRDWEIFNHASKGTTLPNTFFAIRTQVGTEQPVVKVLEAPIQPPYVLSHGYHPLTAAGLPRLAGSTFRGEYPFARIDFDDPDLPVHVQLAAYTPLIPLNPEDSGLPCTILTYTLTNITDMPVAVTLVGSIINPVGDITYDRYGNLQAEGTGQNVNEVRDEPFGRGVFLYSQRYGTKDLRTGNISLATTHPDVTIKRAWVRGAWFDYLQEFWDDFSDDGRLTDLGYETPSVMGKTDTASLGVVDILAPQAQKAYQFVLSWYFPNRPNSWGAEAPTLIRNHYATRFDDSWSVVRYVIENQAHLETQTRQFHTALFTSTLPTYVLDAISANIVPLRSNTCFWLEDGRFYGYEGCFDDGGCCDGTCTHVWSYAQTVAFLFPSLEREMRRIEFTVETNDSGYMFFRTYQTFNEHFIWMWNDEQQPQAAADGQMGSIIRVLREWQLSGDREWLHQIWPGVKRALMYATQHWDINNDGVLDGRQHNTYDIDFYGENPLCGIYYLAALRAVEELALVMNEPELAKRCHTTFAQGSQRLDDLLWNGSFYVQRLDDVNAHKYQHGVGCLSDQLLGQLYARILNLGDLVPAAHTKTALDSIFAHNFKHDFRAHTNTQRTYVFNDEAGLLMCSWPDGNRPTFPFVYSDEVWTGVEYQVAAHLIYEGRITEGLAIIEAIHARHDGIRRNPWDEVECGHHYARSMSSWAVLLALSGVHCDMGRKELSFAPLVAVSDDQNLFRTFWSAGRAWGTYTQERDPAGLWQPHLEVLGGDATGVRVRACGQEWVI